jgi:hypothetical protein
MYSNRTVRRHGKLMPNQTAILLLQTIDAPSPDCLPSPEPFELDTHTSGSNAP